MVHGRTSKLQKVRFYNSVVLLNAATLFLLVCLFQPFGLIRPEVQPIAHAVTTPVVDTQKTSLRTPISGKPIRLEIVQSDNGMHIDLPVREGFYDEGKQDWTLNQTDAFFAMPSVPANDTAGTTLIYGHNEKEVFGHLSAIHQGVGTYALVHTDTGKVFRYTYQEATDLQPHDTSVFRSDGTPTLMVQTCSGSWYELRRMYRFSFERVEP